MNHYSWGNPALHSRAHLPRRDLGQDTHVSSTLGVTAQQTICAFRTPKAGGWRKTIRTATLALSTPPPCTAHQCGVVAPIPAISIPPNDALRILTGCLRPITTRSLLALVPTRGKTLPL
ncbi:unnamed protein product [Clavelina lepadiformis]|uniref:Uncharacterized protein n=1 Tax=Clavelina lepadiformis TaxID=159417 RepID=A0ABP0G287_CLALP